MSDGNRMRVCGLWKHTSKSGATYLSGKVGGVRVLVFHNAEKRSENSPDYSLCIAADERRDETATAETPAPLSSTPPVREEEIPF